MRQGISYKLTYNLALGSRTATVSGRKSGRASFRVPRHVTVLGSTADGQCIDTVGVAITVAIVTLPTTVARCPHVD